MPRRAYIADLQQLSNGSTVEGISNVRPGDDDGEFRFKISPPGEGASYEISALIPDVSEYPSGHEYHIFGDDSAPAHVGEILNRLPSTFGLTLADLLDVVVKAFAEDQDGDALMQDSQYDGGMSEDDDDDDGFSEDDMFGDEGQLSLKAASTTADFTFSPTGSAALRDRIRSDLKSAKDAGFKVGHQGPLLEGQNSYVSLSIRIMKLGISDEAMQSWQLEPSEYLILVIQYPGGYQSMDDVNGIDPAGARKAIAFRIGVSNRYKPTLQEAITAFTKLSVDDETRQKRELIEQANTENHSLGFHDAFISRPLNELLNDRLATILKYRLIGMHWAGAEEFYNDYQGKAFTMTGMDYMDNKYMNEEPRHPAFPSIVTADHLIDSQSGERHSLPLLAMQFLLRHFVRCTEFCLVCHCKLKDDLEALKPYVCDKPLCLYQYMSLGFGPSIEHEIISQPYVVDLLISFCYHSALGGKLGVFPNGLSLSVPPPQLFPYYATSNYGYYATSRNPLQPTLAVTPGSETLEGYKAKLNRETYEILFEKGTTLPVKVGDWICFNSSKQDGSEKLEHCRVIETHLFPVIKISIPVSKPSMDPVDSLPQHQGATPATPKPPKFGSSTYEDLTFYIYNSNFDMLSDGQKRGAIVAQLDLLPPVKELKEYLLRNRASNLASWTERISPVASGILRWIIASNRACIVEVDNPEQASYGQDERVLGMEGWMQFRFAMGAPDKERRFMSAMQSTKDRLKLNHPTLFAWHGSPMQNWHSIIREGLHFRDVSNGRAYGNGCYHSLDFNTSYGYSGRYYDYSGNGRTATTWPSSSLKITCAMALNEIVNAPSEFVSRNPHLVVAQLDWIQTRYLFVQCSSDLKLAVNTKARDVYPQDPSMTPNGQKGKIVIPMSAMPKSRRSGSDISRVRKKMRQSGTSIDPIVIEIDSSDAASIDTDIEDINILIENEENYVAAAVQEDATSYLVPSRGKGKLSGLFSGFKSKASSKLALPSKPATDFVPGTLDYSTLPLLAEPAFATPAASKRLQREFQSLLKVQNSTPLHELGWYTNPEQFNNMYQWIFELHSFDQQLPLAKQMKQKGMKSVVMEMRFGPDYPMSPPFIRIIKPRFLSFMAGGGGHVTAGGSICMEASSSAQPFEDLDANHHSQLLTNSGWSAVSSIESVLLQVRLAISSTDPRPAQLDNHYNGEYGVGEAIDAYIRACQVHGWTPPPNLQQTAMGGQELTGRGRY
jgi:ubiquitin-conjugating enzyme E2 Q